MNLHFKICLYNPYVIVHLKSLKRQIFRNGGSSFHSKYISQAVFGEVREGYGCFLDNKGFSANWSREVGYYCKNATTYLIAVRCRSNGQKRRMADTPPSPTESFIGVGVEKHV